MKTNSLDFRAWQAQMKEKQDATIAEMDRQIRGFLQEFASDYDKQIHVTTERLPYSGKISMWARIDNWRIQLDEGDGLVRVTNMDLQRGLLQMEPVAVAQ